MSPSLSEHDRTGTFEPAIPNGPVATRPNVIGRYLVQDVLGQGGFGLVYLARDDQLQRLVAIKVPHRKLVRIPRMPKPYLAEARTVANLDHPHIVPVHDVGSTEEFPCYIVSKFIEGTDLAKRMQESPLSIPETVDLVATMAEALHYAHRKGLVHRDVKPGNILLDTTASRSSLTLAWRCAKRISARGRPLPARRAT